MTGRQLALLRGSNVGRAKRVTMARVLGSAVTTRNWTKMTKLRALTAG